MPPQNITFPSVVYVFLTHMYHIFIMRVSVCSGFQEVIYYSENVEVTLHICPLLFTGTLCMYVCMYVCLCFIDNDIYHNITNHTV